MFKKEKPWEAGRSHAVLLALTVGSAHGAPSRRLDLDGVQEGPQGLSEGAAEKADTGARVGSQTASTPSSPQAQRHRHMGRTFLPPLIFPPASPWFLMGGVSKEPALHFDTWVSPPVDATISLPSSLGPGWFYGWNRLATYRELELPVLSVLVSLIFMVQEDKIEFNEEAEGKKRHEKGKVRRFC